MGFADQAGVSEQVQYCCVLNTWLMWACFTFRMALQGKCYCLPFKKLSEGVERRPVIPLLGKHKQLDL